MSDDHDWKLDQSSLQALIAMNNAFTLGGEDATLRMHTLDQFLYRENISREAICEAAQRFCSGEVKGQSTRKAPTVPEFVQEAKRIHREVLPYRNRQALPAPEYEPVKGQSPHEVFHGKLAVDYQNYELVDTKVSLDEWNYRNYCKKYPVGTRWQVGRVYVPKKESV